VTHLRQLMIEELQRRNFAPGTIRAYVHGVEHFSQYFHRRPDRLRPEHIRQYQAMAGFRSSKWPRAMDSMAALDCNWWPNRMKSAAFHTVPYCRIACHFLKNLPDDYHLWQSGDSYKCKREYRRIPIELWAVSLSHSTPADVNPAK
jgi:hypothetical protein